LVAPDSVPYDKVFGDEIEEDILSNRYEHPDGEIGDQLKEAFKNIGV
jgi:hypothetical protein